MWREQGPNQRDGLNPPAYSNLCPYVKAIIESALKEKVCIKLSVYL